MIPFEHDYLQDVNLIADNLRDRYKDQFSILKELIQNADDARARRIRFGIFPGLPDSPNMLLQGPGMVVVNDGPFSYSDFLAIRRFGLSNKASDRATIGKFGLGMKSVFHLCEAIFFIAEGEGKVYRELLSPWGAALRPQWDISEALREMLLTHIRRNSLNAVQWEEESAPFILYLPLRRKAQLELSDGQTVGAIIKEYPGDSGRASDLLGADDTGARLGSLLPLLQSVSSVRIYLPTSDGVPKLVHSAELGPECLRPSRHPLDGESALSCRIRLGSRHLLFSGVQRYCMTERLAEIHESSSWPVTRERNDLGHERAVPDKAQPHAAVLFGPGVARGKLTIRWAVYLPVDEQEAPIDMDIPSESYLLTLHGHFFVDAGRNGLYGLDETTDVDSINVKDEAWVRRNWNQELALGATLDLVVPALNRFSIETELTEEQGSALALALTQSRLWLRWKQSIAANYKWVRLVEKGGGRWSILGTEATLPIPRPPDMDLERPWRVFPLLDEVRAHAVLYDERAPNLVANSRELGAWDADHVSRLLDTVTPDRAFSSRTDIGYLVEFIDTLPSAVRGADLVQKALCGLLRHAVASRGVQSLRVVAASVQRIAGQISPSRRIRITLRSTAVIEFLVRQPTSALVWPRDLDQECEIPNPEPEDIELLLTALAGMRDHADACRQCAEELLRQVPIEQRRSLLARAGDIAVLSAFDCGQLRKTSVSSNQLLESWRRGTLFRFAAHGANDQDRALLGPVLQRLLLANPLFVISKEMAELVLGADPAESISACDPSGVLHCLAHQSCELGDFSARKALLGLTQLPDRDPLTIRGLRFLLHGHPDQRESIAPLWVEREEGLTAWRKLWQAVTSPAERWAVIEAELANQLAPAFWPAINLRAVRPEEVVNVLAESGCVHLAPLDMERKEYDTILGYERWDERTWKQLPIHRTTDDRRVAIDGKSDYLQQVGTQIPEGLIARATVIVRSSDPRVASHQEQWIPRLDYRAAILLALRDDEPERWCESILDWLQVVSTPGELLPTLAETSWLRMELGRAVKPANFLILPDLEGEITSLARQSREFGTVSLLPEHLRIHQVFQRHKDDLFTQDRALAALARLIESSERSAVGEIAIDKCDLREIADVLRSSPADCQPKEWAIVFGVCTAYGDDNGCRILNAMLGPMPETRIKRVLGFLRDRQPQPGADKAFLAYLAALAASSVSCQSLRDLVLRAQDGSWKSSTSLCWDVPGASKSVLLCREHAEVLETLLATGHEGDDTPGRSRQARGHRLNIEEYFGPLLQRGLGAQVGALVTLITGRTNLREYAARLLQPHSRDWLLNELPWTPAGLHGVTPGQAFERYVFEYYLADTSSEILTMSLLGELISVPVEARCRHLLFGKPDRLGLNPTTRLCFRKISASDFSDSELSEILRATAEDILKTLYGRPSNLHDIWSKLDHTEPFQISIAEKLILDYLPFYLEQLRPQNAERLTGQLRDVDDCRRRVVEYEGRPELERRKHEYEAKRKQLRDMLKNEPAAQKAVIAAVRERLRDSQYQLSSIPFELFQNADDAYVQLNEIRRFARLPTLPFQDRFVVLNTGGDLSFLHWGRAINAAGAHGFDGRKRGYHRDLEKMLTLSSSEKQTSALGQSVPVTGKFGLGFKSVLLACDRPQILSGSLQIEIVGGVLPKALPEADAQILRRFLVENGRGAASAGTAVMMPSIAATMHDQVLSDFLKYAGYLTAFGLRIREIVYVNGSGGHTVEWSGKTVVGLNAVERGNFSESGLLGAATVSAIRFGLEEGVVLFGIGVNGLWPLPKSAPAVWVTGPTHEDDHFGFAVNAMFDVDPGRARLSAIEGRNIGLAQELGRQLGNVLRALHGANWHQVRTDLGLAPETSEYQFWRSLWLLWQQSTARADSPARRIMSGLLNAAYNEMTGDLAVIPNGLPGSLSALTTVQAVRYKFSGVFALGDTAEPLFTWQVWLQRGFTPETVISTEYAACLTELGFDQVPSIHLTTVVSWLSGQTIRPEDASAVGHILNSVPPESDQNHEVRRDLSDAKTALAAVWFYSQSGSRELPADLLIASADGEEGIRASFAPVNRKLSDEYDGPAIKFFRLCRGQMRGSASDLARWACAAVSLPARQAVIRYLTSGELAIRMRRELNSGLIRGTWLAGPFDIPGIEPELLDELRRPVLDLLQPEPPVLPLPRIRNPRSILHRVEHWWAINGAEELQTFDRKFYPHGRVPELVAPWQHGFTARLEHHRSEWLVLLGRAAFYKMGLVTDSQHRAFIEHAQRERYWSVFAAAEPQNRADEWMNVLESFYDRQVDATTWEYWIRSFPQFYNLSRRLDDYANLFLDLDRQNGRFDLTFFLATRNDAAQQGGGIDAPLPSLGIGACFVVRELLRHGHIHNEYAREHAFVPTGAVRRLMEEIGFEVDSKATVEGSAQIFEQLAQYLDPVRATFGGAYDIPFQIIAADAELRAHLLDGSANRQGA